MKYKKQNRNTKNKFKNKNKIKEKKSLIIKRKKEKEKNLESRNLSKKQINLGIELLRMILSFLIVLVHNFFYSSSRIQQFPVNNLPYYVPLFMLISFYFSFNSLSSRNIDRIKQRFIRILYPYIGWPIILWLRENYYNYKRGKKELILIKNLYYQILIGCGLHGLLWFLFNLLFLSLFFTIIVFIFKKYSIVVLFLINIPLISE